VSTGGTVLDEGEDVTSLRASTARAVGRSDVRSVSCNDKEPRHRSS
jgi:hypothetical protein